MTQVAPLAYGPNRVTEPGLVLMGDSFDRTIEQAHRSVCKDKISVFNPAKIDDRSVKQHRTLAHSEHCIHETTTLQTVGAARTRTAPRYYGARVSNKYVT
jgi:hypothetical protein